MLATEELLRKWTAGDEDAVKIAWTMYGGRFTGRLANRFRPFLAPDECEEVVSAALAHSWWHRTDFDVSKGSFEAWFWQIVYHRAAEELRQLWRKERENEASLAPEELAYILGSCCAESRELDDIAVAPNSSDLVDRAMTVLSEVERTVLQADLDSPNGSASTAELSKELGVSQSAVRSYRARTRAKVKAELIWLGYTGRPNDVDG